jgi:uncharacterized membrane protein YdbT with pleckstrin-like domain
MNETVTEKNYSVEKKWILKTIWGTLLGLVVFIPAFIITWITGAHNFSGYIIYISFYLIFAPIHIVIVTLQRINFHYALEDTFIVIHQGIIAKKQRSIPYGVIQNIFVKQDVFDRIFGLASIIIENASQGGGQGVQNGNKVFGITINNQKSSRADTVGFSGNMVSIPGLTKQNAETVKNIIMQKMKDHPIEDSQSGL